MNNKGLTLIEVTICLGLLGLTLLIFIAPQIEMQKTLKKNDNKISRVLSNQLLQQKITFTDFTLEKSAKVSPANDLLCPCVMGGNMKVNGTKICTINTCTSGVATDFIFYDNAAQALVALSGTSQSPVYYDANGNLCQPDTAKNITCSYKSTMKFIAHCPGGLSACDHADFLTLELSLLAIENQSMKESIKTFIYPVKLNYQPVVSPIANQVLQIPLQSKIPVNVNPGDASEYQNFIFQMCKSSDDQIVEVHCYKFVDGVGQMVLTPKVAGLVTISLQVNDGGLKNNLSEIISFSVTSNP